MFRGNTTVNLDEKGRFAIPTRYRSRVQETCACQMIVTVAVDERCVGMEGCLWIYPLPEWEELEKKIKELPAFNKMAAKLKRFLIGNAYECEMDTQGRILLPEKLRNFANLHKKVVLVGQLNRFEVWNEEIWAKKELQFMDSEDVEGLDDLGNLFF
nr:division/cell wall cluster transcriptional repressor MraZ [Crenothrix polyspora]